MRLDELTVGSFKNLKDFHIDFDEGSPYTVLVGENGAGKSNLIEAITIIFRNLDLDEAAAFQYRLKYRCREHDVEVIADTAEQFPRFRARPKGTEEPYADLPRKRFMEVDDDGRPLYRPAFVFGYYSGPSDRLAGLYRTHEERYYRWIIKSPEQRGGRAVDDPNALRRLFYAQTMHGQFALLAFFMAPGDDAERDRAFLRQHLQIDGLDSVLFALRKPSWGNARKKGGDARFWHAEGEIRTFLERLYEVALLPARMARRIPADLGRDGPVEGLYLFLPKAEDLHQVYESYGDQYAFFTALESAHLSRVIGDHDVRTRVRLTTESGGGAVTYRELSEGEQQLLLVLGLLKFTARDDALFLLDEPDTHLNPVWSTQYLEFLDRFIRTRERGESCHIIMSSHDPLVLAGLGQTQVRILRRDTAGRAIAEPPMSDPRGMGIQAILASDLFRLPAAGLDTETQHELEEQRKLAVEENISVEQQQTLRDVTDRLNRKGFWKSDRDPLYQLFLQRFLPQWIERAKPEWQEAVQISPEHMQERDALADEIAAEIAEEAKAERAARE
ncbi:AAA family ATPase [Roseomonas haemaphysalidis]|uniref:AAA family ATPase n=1 Tax=Roseomonas haemaphysalidis TaxID=2768162 RepID=A0ABS3KW32_9PROT|nr:AAA family ATPase [Roseomonas haemaphysalidis]MBO1081683.1 AAA family ATPase [Roseomonas haemaphysalidis]